MAWDPNNRYIGTNPNIITVSNTPQPQVDQRALRQQQALSNNSVDQRSARQADALRNVGNVRMNNSGSGAVTVGYGSGAVRATTTAVPSNITPMINPYTPPQTPINVNVLPGRAPVVTFSASPCFMEQSNYNNRSVQTIIRLIDRSSNIITVSDGSQWRIDPRLFDLDGWNPGDSLLIRSNGRSYDITGPSVTVFPNTLGSGGPIVAVKAPATSNANNNNFRH